MTIDYHTVGAQANLSLTEGTYVDGDYCTYTASGTVLNCNSTIGAEGTEVKVMAAAR